MILMRNNGSYAGTYTKDRPGRQMPRRRKKDAPSISLGAFKFRDVDSGDILIYDNIQSTTPFGEALLKCSDVAIGTILKVRAPGGVFNYEILETKK